MKPMQWFLQFYPPDEEPIQHLLMAPEMTLGFSQDCDICIREESVSGTHARFFRAEDGHWWLEDLKSTNGTWIDGDCLYYPLAISEGMKLEFGSVVAHVLAREVAAK